MPLVTLLVPLGILLALVGLLAGWSPGRCDPVVDDEGRPIPGSLAEKLWVDVNGVPQGMFLRARDPSRPVLLFLHGGPGMPLYFLDRRLPTGLEQLFTVCWWEQRGAGLSYRADLTPQTVTIEQLIADTLAVTDYLRERFGVPKIYLMGHSWGSFIGIQAAARAPEKYYAYIGVSQLCRQLASEGRAYDHMVEECRRTGNTRLLRRLEAAPRPTQVPLPRAYHRLRDPAMHQLGVGTTRDMRSVVTGVFVPVWRTRAYTLREKANIWRGKWSSWSAAMWNEMLAADLNRSVPAVGVPVYFLHGRYDYTCCRAEAQEYFDGLVAPSKRFYTFPDSAHAPIFEEPERSLRILEHDVLTGPH